MNNEEVKKRLKTLKIEDIIWLIYIGIIIASWYSNNLERDYFINRNNQSKEKYRKIIITIFIILIICYVYFLNDSYQDIKNLKNNETTTKKNLVYLSFIGSLLVTISGFIFLYIAIKDEKLDIEIAFN